MYGSTDFASWNLPRTVVVACTGVTSVKAEIFVSALLAAIVVVCDRTAVLGSVLMPGLSGIPCGSADCVERP